MSTILTKEQRLRALVALGAEMREPDADLDHLIQTAHRSNAWFTPENTRRAVIAMGGMLNERDLGNWFSQWEASEEDRAGRNPLKIGLILAGNIPLVGLHDVICVLAAGDIALIKQSSQDQKLIPFLLKKLDHIEPAFADYIQYVDRLEDFDAVIATGSNNSSRYFLHYFSKVPHIIRKNRNSVAVLTGSESSADLKCLGRDIFDYFGLGCRNVSKLYVPVGYGFEAFFQAIEEFKSVANHHKYFNNYEYNKSIYLVNGEAHLDNGFLLVKKDERLSSPLAVLHYEEYQDLSTVESKLRQQEQDIQCVVSSAALTGREIAFGVAQHPKIWDYADNVNTMEFLTSL